MLLLVGPILVLLVASLVLLPLRPFRRPFVRARLALRRLERPFPTLDALALLSLARRAYRHRRRADARFFLRRVVARYDAPPFRWPYVFSSVALAHAGLGRMLAEEERWAEALPHLARAHTLYALSGRKHHDLAVERGHLLAHMARCHIALHNYRAATVAAAEARQAAPEWYYPRYLMALLAHAEGRTEDLYRFVREAVELEPAVRAHFRSSPDLKCWQDDPRFRRALLPEMRIVTRQSAAND